MKDRIILALCAKLAGFRATLERGAHILQLRSSSIANSNPVLKDTLDSLEKKHSDELSAFIVKQETDNDIQKFLVDENTAADEEEGKKCAKEVNDSEVGTNAIKQYVVDIEEYEALKNKVNDIEKELYDVTKSGGEKCGRLAQDLDHYKRKAKRRREAIEKSKKALEVAIFSKEEQVAINLRQEKMMDAAKLIATENESKLKKEIEILRKSVPSVSKLVEKPVDYTPPKFAMTAPPRVIDTRVSAPPLIHTVKEFDELRLQKNN